MLIHNIVDLNVGERCSLDLTSLFTDYFNREISSAEDGERLYVECGKYGYIEISFGPHDDDPYIDWYVDDGFMHCDGEVVEILNINENEEYVDLLNVDEDTYLRIGFDQAIHCLNKI